MMLNLALRAFGRAPLLAAAILALSITALPALATAQQFSADMVNAAGSGPSGRSQKIYVQAGKIRMEGTGMKGGAVIADADAKTAIMLMPEQKAYFDMARMGMMIQALRPVDPNNPCPQWQEMARMRPNGGENEGAWTCQRIGPEQVNGRSTVKYEATSPKGEHITGWIDPKLKFLVKTESAQGRGMELRNIQEGPQQASLFEIPTDYRKMDMGDMIKRMMPQGAKPPG
jgi:hypothetical protein